ncbi:hypothetical protein N665_1072s0008 [Sinapis alba]|nr:hypothetical protein N665_1072s0008 [Sinapis alba]
MTWTNRQQSHHHLLLSIPSNLLQGLQRNRRRMLIFSEIICLFSEGVNNFDRSIQVENA